MGKQSIDAMVEGGKATAAPPLGPALGPLGVNIGKVISEINKKTESFKGMQVPVKIIVDSDTKDFTITVGTPPVSALVKKEANLEKGSGNPLADKVAEIKIEQVIKISKMKLDSLSGKDTKARVKEIVGTCNSMGVMVEGMDGKTALKKIDEGMFEEEIKAEKTELSAEELKEIEEKKKKLQEDIEKRKAEFTALAKQIIESLVGQPRGAIKSKLIEAKVPTAIIEELLPTEGAGAAGAGAMPGPDGKPAKAAATAGGKEKK